MNVRYQMTRELYEDMLKDVQLIFASNSRKPWLSTLYIALAWTLGMALAIIGFSMDYDLQSDPAFVAATLAIILALPLNWYLNRSISNNYSQAVITEYEHGFHDELFIEISADAISIVSKNGNCQMAWGGVSNIYAGKHFYLLLCDHLTISIPYTALGTQCSKQEFQMEVEQLSGKHIVGLCGDG